MNVRIFHQNAQSATFLVAVFELIFLYVFGSECFGQGVPKSFTTYEDNSHLKLDINGQLQRFPWPVLRHQSELWEISLIRKPEFAEWLSIEPSIQEKLKNNCSDYDSAYKKLKQALKGQGKLIDAEAGFSKIAAKTRKDFFPELSKEQLKAFRDIVLYRQVLMDGPLQLLESGQQTSSEGSRESRPVATATSTLSFGN